jgi:hypothetical protein
MSTYSLKQLLDLWAQGRLTAEQLLGQMLQHLAAQGQQIKTLEQRVGQLEQQPPAKP